MEIPFHQTNVGEDEIEAIADVLRSGWLTTGSQTVAFEDEFSKAVNARHALFVNSATSALMMALRAIQIQPGDEVIIPSVSFVSSIEVIESLGAVPVVCDVDYESHNLNLDLISGLISKRTKAIIPVHMAGYPVDIDKLGGILDGTGVLIIEDAAHAFPSELRKKPVGSISPITIYSLYATKTITCGEGGVIVCDDDDRADYLRKLRLHGMSKDAWKRYENASPWEYDVEINGGKFNQPDFLAAMARTQLQKSKLAYLKRKKIHQFYSDNIINDKVILPLDSNEDYKSSFHLYFLKVKNNKTFTDYMRNNGVSVSMHFIPMHRLSYYADRYGFRKEEFPVAEKLYHEAVSIPIYDKLEDKHLTKIVDLINEYQMS